MSADDVVFHALDVVGYADDLPRNLLPRLVAPIFRQRTNANLFLLPPYTLTGEGLSDFSLTSKSDFERAVILGQATKVGPFQARPDYRLWIDLDYSPRYEPTDEVSNHLRAIAHDHVRQAKTALRASRYGEAAKLAQVAIAADERCLDALLVKAIVHRSRGEGDEVDVLREIAESVSPDVEFLSWVDMYSPLASPVGQHIDSLRVYREVVALAQRQNDVSDAELIACVERAQESQISVSQVNPAPISASRDQAADASPLASLPEAEIPGFVREIESVIASHRAIKQTVVMVREDTPDEKQLVAYLEWMPATAVPTFVLTAFLEKKLPTYKIPAAFVLMDSWPLSASGEIDRRALPVPSDELLSLNSDLIAPRTPSEERLAGIWRDLFGVQQIGIRDDFFHLGGHSLLAAQLLARVQREFGVRVRPSVLFEHTTLEELARVIDPASSIADSGPNAAATVARASRVARPAHERSLFQLAPSNGTSKPFFWVHGVGGEVFQYAALSQHLAAVRPVFGFTAHWSHISGQDTPTLEVLAAHYVRELLRVHPSGPYHLGGYGSAALLALEMARQLEAKSAPVGVLAAIDCDVEPYLRSPGIHSAFAFLGNLPHWVRDEIVKGAWKDLTRRLKSRMRHLFALSGYRDYSEAGDDLYRWRFSDPQVAILKAHHTAFGSYRALPFGGKITLFYPRTAPLLGPWRSGHGPVWEELARDGVEVYRVRGSSLSMLIEPFAAELASYLNLAMERAERAYRDIRHETAPEASSRRASAPY